MASSIMTTSMQERKNEAYGEGTSSSKSIEVGLVWMKWSRLFDPKSEDLQKMLLGECHDTCRLNIQDGRRLMP